MWGVVRGGPVEDTMNAKLISLMLGDTSWRMDRTSERELLEVSDGACKGYRFGDLLRASDGEQEEDLL